MHLSTMTFAPIIADLNFTPRASTAQSVRYHKDNAAYGTHGSLCDDQSRQACQVWAHTALLMHTRFSERQAPRRQQAGTRH
jgi:hypothetical protein